MGEAIARAEQKTGHVMAVGLGAAPIGESVGKSFVERGPGPTLPADAARVVRVRKNIERACCFRGASHHSAASAIIKIGPASNIENLASIASAVAPPSATARRQDGFCEYQ